MLPREKLQSFRAFTQHKFISHANNNFDFEKYVGSPLLEWQSCHMWPGGYQEPGLIYGYSTVKGPLYGEFSNFILSRISWSKHSAFSPFANLVGSVLKLHKVHCAAVRLKADKIILILKFQPFVCPGRSLLGPLQAQGKTRDVNRGRRPLLCLRSRVLDGRVKWTRVAFSGTPFSLKIEV